MSAATAGRLAKPKLRRLLLDSLKVHIPIAIGLAVATQFSLKFFFKDVRREKIAEFYRTYDAEKEAERLERIGFFERKG
ncbi:cytochrome c oxidase subunit cyclope [Dermatophagoides pteronyssinus]|uniref:cytochrome c oxidase subunit cyclope n=1 Tax=Dermatophagoides pteronyssinus TaxID=6956 RepID=UPI003F674572